MKKFVKILSLVLAAFILLSAYPVFAADSAAVSGVFNYSYANEVLELVNAERKAAGLNELVMDAGLVDSAMLRAAECSVEFSHTRPNGESWSTVVDWDLAGGENIASGQTSPEMVVNGWMNSQGHRENILGSSYTKIGVGCFRSSGGRYHWAQEFSGGSSVNRDNRSGTRSVTVSVPLTAGAEAVIRDNSGNETPSTDPTSGTKPTSTPGTIPGSKPTPTPGSKSDYYPTIGKVTLAKTSYIYDGKVKTPSVKVTDKYGNKLSESYYIVDYPTGRKNVGSYTVTVISMVDLKTYRLNFKIKPVTVSLSKVTPKKKGFKASWKKKTTQVTGYKLRYSKYKDFRTKKTLTIKKNTTSKAVTKLKANKAYYVRIRTYKTVNGTKYYSKWSKTKVVVTK